MRGPRAAATWTDGQRAMVMVMATVIRLWARWQVRYVEGSGGKNRLVVVINNGIEL